MLTRLLRICLIVAAAASGWVLIWYDAVSGFALLIVAPIIPALRSRKAAIHATALALAIPAIVIWVLLPLSLLAWPQPFEVTWTYRPVSNAYKSVSIHSKGTTRRLGWFSRKAVWGYSILVSSLTVVTLTSNGGEPIVCRVSTTDYGEAQRKLMSEDGTAEPFTIEGLKTWLQKKNVTLSNWTVHGELGELYFAIFAATWGPRTPPEYRLLVN